MTGAMPAALGDLGAVSIAANTSQGRWVLGFPQQYLVYCWTQSGGFFHPKRLIIQLTSASAPSATSLPPALRPCPDAERGPGVGAASSHRHHPLRAGPAVLGRNIWSCWMCSRAQGQGSLHSSTSPGPCPAASQQLLLRPHPHPRNYLFVQERLFPGNLSSAEGHFQLQGANKQFERPRF